jgi:predicted O-methyltransferase YrrM
LQIVQLLKTVPLYISYFFKVVDLHSLQAPYIYRFYSGLISGLNSAKADSEIETVREELKKNKLEIKGGDLGAGSRVIGFSGGRKISSVAKFGISSGKDCLFISQLASMTQGRISLELGTSFGLTTAYLSRANPSGRIYTFEGNEDLCEVALANWQRLNCRNIYLIRGGIDFHLDSILQNINEIDFAIIDANHQKKAVMRYFEVIYPKMSRGGIVLVDDIRWSVEMYRAWSLMIKDARVSLSIEFSHCGLLIFEDGISKQHYVLSY